MTQSAGLLNKIHLEHVAEHEKIKLKLERAIRSASERVASTKGQQQADARQEVHELKAKLRTVRSDLNKARWASLSYEQKRARRAEREGSH